MDASHSCQWRDEWLTNDAGRHAGTVWALPEEVTDGNLLDQQYTVLRMAIPLPDRSFQYVPFDGDVEYLINNEVVRIKQGYITLFWACTPYQLTRPGDCKQMAIFNLPMHLFLSWPLDRELINHVTHGMVIKSLAAQQLSVFEVQRWRNELNSDNEQIHQLAIDEINNKAIYHRHAHKPRSHTAA